MPNRISYLSFLHPPLLAPQHREQPRHHNRETRLANRSQSPCAPSKRRNRRARAACAGALSRRSSPHRRGRTPHESAAGVTIRAAPGRHEHGTGHHECLSRAFAHCGRARERGAGSRGGRSREAGGGVGAARCVALRDREVAAGIRVDGAGVGTGGVAGGGGALPA